MLYSWKPRDHIAIHLAIYVYYLFLYTLCLYLYVYICIIRVGYLLTPKSRSVGPDKVVSILHLPRCTPFSFEISSVRLQCHSFVDCYCHELLSDISFGDGWPSTLYPPISIALLTNASIFCELFKLSCLRHNSRRCECCSGAED